MDPTDFADVTGDTYTYLLNGLTPESNWTGLFRTGEKVRLRFIDAGAMTYFDVRIPDLKMTVVQADGQNVRARRGGRVSNRPRGNVRRHRPARGPGLHACSLNPWTGAATRAARWHPSEGMSAAVPPRRSRPLRTMVDMGMGMEMSGMARMEGRDGRAKVRGRG